jgi:threonine dehydrogenase-like Zn-dependent dehydrogenase
VKQQKGDVRVGTVPDPKIEGQRDTVIKITLTAICGSDLHLYDGHVPTMESGDSGMVRTLTVRAVFGNKQATPISPRAGS